MLCFCHIFRGRAGYTIDFAKDADPAVASNEKDGVVLHIIHHQVSPKVGYGLTE
jgi:hypothetical protein